MTHDRTLPTCDRDPRPGVGPSLRPPLGALERCSQLGAHVLTAPCCRCCMPAGIVHILRRMFYCGGCCPACGEKESIFG